MTWLQFFVFVALPITGMCYAVLGALKLPLAKRLNLDEAKVGGLVSAFGIMVGPIILAAGFVSDAIGRQGVWIGGSVMITTALILLAIAKRYVVAVVAVLLLSGGWAAMINVANPVMKDAFENPLVALNVGDFFFGLGAFLTPPGIAFLLRKIGFSKAVSFLAGLGGLAIVLGIFINLQPNAVAASTEKMMGFRELISDPVMWLSASILMLWAPLESVTAAWSTTFVTAQAPPEEKPIRTKRIAEWTLAGFWLGFMGARLLMAGYHTIYKAEDPILEARIFHVVLAVLAIGAMALLVVSKKRGLTIGTILAAGLLMGPFFPNLMAILLDHFPPHVSGRAVGVLFAGASIGWTLLPLLIGAMAKKWGSLHRAFVIAVVDAIVLLGLVIWHLIMFW